MQGQCSCSCVNSQDRVLCSYSVGLFGDGADVEIAVAPVFVEFVTATRWMKDQGVMSYLSKSYPQFMLIVATPLHGIYSSLVPRPSLRAQFLRMTFDPELSGGERAQRRYDTMTSHALRGSRNAINNG